jgi:hypothetical protein
VRGVHHGNLLGRQIIGEERRTSSLGNEHHEASARIASEPPMKQAREPREGGQS